MGLGGATIEWGRMSEINERVSMLDIGNSICVFDASLVCVPSP